MKDVTELQEIITQLQNLNDELFNVVEILHRKQENKEVLTIQAYLVEKIAKDMHDLLAKAQ